MSAKNFLITIGIDKYEKWDKLNNAASDAMRFHHLLSSKYNFESHELLIDSKATRKAIFDAIASIDTLIDSDNLVIFFAGHGLMYSGRAGYWIPCDGVKDDFSTYYPTSELLTHVRECAAKHVLIISDSCFSGTILMQSRGSTYDFSHEQLGAKKSRWAFVSGGLESVTDGEPGAGSPFANAIIKYLGANTNATLAAGQLFDAVKILMKGIPGLKQTVQADEIRCNNHDGGQLIFRLSDLADTDTAIPSKEQIDHYKMKFTDLEHYIPRTITPLKDAQEKATSWVMSNSNSAMLHSFLKQQRKIVLLGTAGSGKSIELKNLTKSLLENGEGFLPVYAKLNYYVDEPFEKLLPDGWNRVEEDRTILILDGLDEIPSTIFFSAIRRLYRFSEAYPLVRIIISCRTNFYEYPSNERDGTLENFSPFLLDEISLQEIKKFITNTHNLNAEKFIGEASENNYLDLITNPYFLKILIQFFKDRGNLNAKRSIILESSLKEFYLKSKDKFRTTIEYPLFEHVIAMLEKLAFVMELLGKNFLFTSEVATIFKGTEEITRMKYMPLFHKAEDDEKWMFDHNNIQEFLAAQVLKKQPFDKILDLLTISTKELKRLKPSWYNTISFFVSICEEEKSELFLNWVSSNEPEALVKFDPERIAKPVRISVFKQTLEYYNSRNLIISSNKFTHKDLARFGNFGELIDHLLNIIENSSSIIEILNCVYVLRNYKLDSFKEHKDKVREMLLNLALSNRLENSGLYVVMRAITEMQLNTAQAVEQLVNKYSKHKNQYLRAGLYDMIAESSFLNQYADVFFDSIHIEKAIGFIDDRDPITLLDEKLTFEKGIRRITSSDRLKKLLTAFIDDQNQHLLHSSEIQDTLNDIVSNCVRAYPNDLSIFDKVIKLYVHLASWRITGRDYKLDHFFVATKTVYQAIKCILLEDEMLKHKKDDALEILIDDTVIASFINDYQAGEFTSEHAQFLVDILKWSNRKDLNLKRLILNIISAVEERESIKIEYNEPPNWAEINKIRAKVSFDLLFSKEELIAQIRKVYSDLDKTTIVYTNIASMVNSDQPGTPFVVLDILRRKTNTGRGVHPKDLEDWIESQAFDEFKFATIYRYLNDSNNSLSVTNEQQEDIRQWCLTPGQEEELVWFFITKFEIRLEPEQLLKFTEFYDYTLEVDIYTKGTIEKLERFLDRELIKDRVRQNLNQLSAEFTGWVSNAGYALRNNIVNTNDSILQGLKSVRELTHKIPDVLKLWFEKTKDIEGLKLLVKTSFSHYVRDDAISILKDQPIASDFLKRHFGDVMENDTLEILDRTNAANELIQLEELKGFYFLSKLILEKKDPKTEYMRITWGFKYLKDANAIPALMELLSLAVSPVFQEDRYNRLDMPLLDAISSIGIRSENNFSTVKNSLEKFMTDMRPYVEVDFLQLNINRMQDEITMNISKTLDVVEALNVYSTLGRD